MVLLRFRPFDEAAVDPAHPEYRLRYLHFFEEVALSGAGVPDLVFERLFRVHSEDIYSLAFRDAF